MKLCHINHDKTKLIIFFGGFYTDENCFCDFDCGESDILFVYDYSEINPDIFDDFDFTPYVKINLIAYSYGVWACGLIKNELPEINNSVAICGTFMPVDDNYGVPKRVFDIMLNALSETTLEDFERKMFHGVDMKKSLRTLENLRSELDNIAALAHLKSNFDFDKVIIARRDRIIPYASQMNFWAQHPNKTIVETGHFPFEELGNFELALN